MRTTWSLAGALTAAVVAAACGGKPAQVAVPPQAHDMVGTWKLNPTDSDRPQDEMGAMGEGTETQGRGGRGRGGRGGFGGGRGGGMGGMEGGEGGEMRGGGGGQVNFEAVREGMQYARRTPTMFVFREDDSTVALAFDGGTPHSFHVDGRTMKEQTDLGQHMKTKVHWQGRDLVIQRDWGSGVKLSETYFISQDTGQMFVIVSLRTPQRQDPIVFRRVYDREAAGR
jgi:hypothetical protein